MYDFYHVRSSSILSLVERSAASWSALGTWKCSCFGNRGDLGVLGMCGCDDVIGKYLEISCNIISRLRSKPNILMLPFCPTPTLAVRHLESWHIFSFNRKVVECTIFRCWLLFFGGVVMFVVWFIRICQAEVHIGLGPSQVQSGKCLGVRSSSLIVPTNSWGKREKRPSICCRDSGWGHKRIGEISQD